MAASSAVAHLGISLQLAVARSQDVQSDIEEESKGQEKYFLNIEGCQSKSTQ